MCHLHYKNRRVWQKILILFLSGSLVHGSNKILVLYRNMSIWYFLWDNIWLITIITIQTGKINHLLSKIMPISKLFVSWVWYKWCEISILITSIYVSPLNCLLTILRGNKLFFIQDLFATKRIPGVELPAFYAIIM